jgi:HK97 family phage portal protein
MGIWQKTKSLFGIEGAWRGPFAGVGELGGWYELGRLEDGYQRGLDVSGYGARNVPAVYACGMVISRSVGQCYPRHVRVTDGQIVDVTTSAAFRVMKNPNSYQTTPEFLLNMVATALFEGEAYALAVRNDRYEVSALHPLPRGACSPMIDEDTREVFYAIGSSPLAPGGTDYIVPARDILAFRFHTPRHPLVGESPIKSAALAIGIDVALSRTQAAFFANMNRPSGIISTHMQLNREQITSLRSAFDEQSKGMAAGKIPVLAGGLKFQPISISSQDAQLVEAQRMSVESIARCFGVPTPLIGDLSHATLNNAETLIQHFLSMSLGSYLETIERAFDRLFGLDGTREYVELDTAALLRTDFAGRVEGLTKAIQGGLFSPNEGRAREGLGPVEGGDSIFLQRQNTPVDLLSQLAANELVKPEPAPAVPTPEPTPSAQPEPTKELDPDVFKALIQMKKKDLRTAA